MMTRLAAAAISAVALVALSACSGASAPETTAPPAPPTDGAPSAPVTGEAFEGPLAEHVITVGPQEIVVPIGIELPAESTVTVAEPSNVTIADADPSAVIEAVKSSAEANGYELYAQPRPDTTIWVGHGNVVMLMAVPNAQILNWGPEAMKEVLAGG